MNTIMILLNIGGQEIIIILLIVLVLFGGRKIPELMKGLGKGVREYKRAVKSMDDEMSTDDQQHIETKQDSEDKQ